MTKKDADKNKKKEIGQVSEPSLHEYMMERLNKEFPTFFFVKIAESPLNLDDRLTGKILGLVRGQYPVREITKSTFSYYERHIPSTLFKGVLIDIFEPMEGPGAPPLENQFLNYQQKEKDLHRHYSEMGLVYLCHHSVKWIFDEMMVVLDQERKYAC